MQMVRSSLSLIGTSAQVNSNFIALHYMYKMIRALSTGMIIVELYPYWKLAEFPFSIISPLG